MLEKKRYVMPRPRKYDYKDDYPVTKFIKIPVRITNELDKRNISDEELSKIVEKFLEEYLKKTMKKD